MIISRSIFATLCFLVSAAMAFGTTDTPHTKRTVGILLDSLVSEFWVEGLVQMRQEADKRGWTVMEAVSNMDDNKQYQQLQSMLQRGVDCVIIIHTDDKAVIPAIRLANAAGVPMVHFNRPPAPSDAYSVAVVADNRKIMAATVHKLVEKARQQGGKYKAVILLGDLGDANGVHRRDGFQDAIAQHRDVVEVVARVATEWNADKAFAGLSNALQAHPDINMLVTSSDFMMPQIEQALRVAGKWKRTGEPGHVMLAGFDGDANAYAQLTAGYCDVDGVQDLHYEVKLTFDALDQMLAGKRPPRILVDAGFVVTQETVVVDREKMWGYAALRAKAEGRQVSASDAQKDGGDLKAADRSRWTLEGFLDSSRELLGAMFSVATARDIVLAMLPLALLVAGQMLVLLIAQIDLSMTAVMAMCSVAGASAMTRAGAEGSTTLGLAAFLLVGAMAGLGNGLCTARLKMPSFIVTLAMMMFGSGAAVWYASTVSDTISIGGLPAAFRTIGYGSIAGIPVAPVLCLVILGGVWHLLRNTIYGRWIYAIGHNVQVARISGVPVNGVTIAVFTFSGLCAALASIIYTSRIETGLPTLGQSMLLDIVGAAVIGGVSLFGGRGNVRMALVGVFFLVLLDKTLQLLGLSLFLVLAIKGFAIMAAATVDVMRKRRRDAA